MTNDNKRSSLKNPSSFRPDYGLYLQRSLGGSSNSTVHLTDTFGVEILVMYSDGKSSITGRVGDRVVTFDFDDEILKVFIYIFTTLKVIDRTDLEIKIRKQQDEPIVIKFEDSPILIKGMVLSCKFGKVEKSTVTGEEFLPLVIKSAEIVKEPGAILVES